MASSVRSSGPGARDRQPQPQHPGQLTAEPFLGVDGLEVGEHAGDDRQRPDRVEAVIGKRRLRAVELVEHPAAVGVQQLAPGERVDVADRLVEMAQQEVAGHADPGQPDPEPPPDLHAEHRQADRDAGPAADDLVQQGVGRVVVGLVVAGEPEFAEEPPPPAVEAGLGSGGQLVDAAQLGRDVDARVGMRGDQQGRLVEGDRLLRSLHELDEAFGGLVHAGQATRPRPREVGPPR
jgi:hypothetical protein